MLKNINKYIIGLLFILSLICCISAKAETVSQKQAASMAQQFFNEANRKVVAPVKLVYNGRKLTTNRLFVPFYIYNNPAGGFVIISAENKAFPILGYSLTESFDPNNIGEKTKALLSAYARDIELVRYDSSIPIEAIKAWNDYPHYVTDLLNAKYVATDPRFSMDEATKRIWALIDSGKALETASDIYSPEQWNDLVSRELNTNQSVAVGYISPEHVVTPAIIYGHKGDYYRIELDNRNQWLMRLLPTEILSGAQLVDFSFPTEITDDFYEEEPFKFQDEFLEEVVTGRIASSDYNPSNLDIVNDDPVINGIGGGHYEIMLPENVRFSSVYNLSGAITKIQTYKSTNIAHIDLSPEPSGFYLVLLIGESGKPYGVKITR